VSLIQSLFNSGWLVSTPINPATVGVLVDGRRNNIGSLVQNGLDVNAQYQFKTPIGQQTPSLAANRKLYEAAKAAGLNIRYREFDANHGGMIPLALPGVFAFLDDMRQQH
jgi:hypothetical protein